MYRDRVRPLHASCCVLDCCEAAGTGMLPDVTAVLDKMRHYDNASAIGLN